MDIRPLVVENPLLAILRNVPLEKTIDYAEAIVKGGVKFFEVAMNSEHACEQISMMRKHFSDDVKIGAGTVITMERAHAALDAGAGFFLSPSTDLDVLDFCQKEGIMMMPGAMTPTDVSNCMRRGFYTVKLFPAGDLPPKYIKSLKGPLDGTEYVAIGGVTPDNIGTFFQNGFLGVGLGSAMIPKAYVANNEWEKGSEYVKDLLNRIAEAKKA